MPEERNTPGRPFVWVSGLLVLPLGWILRWILPPSPLTGDLVFALAAVLAPLPGLLFYRRRHHRALRETANAREEAEQLKLQLQNVRFRAVRLRE